MNQTVSDYRFKFSVVTAVYNVEPYLAEAIESILTQDIGFEESVEIILVDDGSTDRSGAICDEYQQKFPDNIKVIHKENGGASSARNEGIRHTSGRFVSFMDADDKLTPETLSAVYDFFIQSENQIDLVSVPIYYFEKRDTGHKLNYKYDTESPQIIDLTKQYSYVQMHISSSFIRRALLNENTFDTSLRYAEDAKAIMSLLLNNPKYGVVPAGRYMYRTRSALNSALNVSKHRKEWYIDSLKYYTFWALDESERRLGYVPDFVQYTIMYDLLARFRMKKFPDDVMTAHEKESFLSMLFRALQRIDDHIVIEQHNLSPELCDYLLSIKKAPDSGTLVYDADAENQYFHYSDFNSCSSASYPVFLETLDFQENALTLQAHVKIYTRFPYPSKMFLRLISGSQTQIIDCSFYENRDEGALFNGQQLSLTLYFTAVIPYDMLKSSTKVEFCMISGSNTIKFHSFRRGNEFPVTPENSRFKSGKHVFYVTLASQSLNFEPGTPVARLKHKAMHCARVIRRHI